jgi:hypothetical protein
MSSIGFIFAMKVYDRERMCSFTIRRYIIYNLALLFPIQHVHLIQNPIAQNKLDS